MNITLLIDKWVERKEHRSIIERAVIDECISDLKMMASGELREPHRLDSRCPFKKHKDKFWKEVIEEDPSYVDWLLNNENMRFQLDEIAHAYLVEIQAGKEGDYSYNDIRD